MGVDESLRKELREVRKLALKTIYKEPGKQWMVGSNVGEKELDLGTELGKIEKAYKSAILST